jgi:phage shock protein C
VNQQTLYRSTDDRIISGVAGGLAEYLDMDPTLVRVIWIISFIVTGSITFWIYLVMMVVVPAQPAEWPQQSPWAPGGTPAGGAPFAGSTSAPGSSPAGYAAQYSPPPAPGAAFGAASGAPGWVPGPDPAAPAGSVPGWVPGESQGWVPGEGQGTAPAADPDPTLHGAPPAAGAPAGWWGGDWRDQRRQDRWQRRQQRHQERWERRQERWQQRAQDREYHSYGGPGLTFGLMLVLVGGLLAWHQFDANFDLGNVWPIAIIAFGAILVSSAFRFRNR